MEDTAIIALYFERDEQAVAETAAYAYKEGIVIVAQVVEELPDVYRQTAASSAEYKVLRLKVLESVTGSGFPDEIFFLCPLKYVVDFSVYPEIVFAVTQLGIEDYLLCNQTAHKMETFSQMFGIYNHHFTYVTGGLILPFTDGKLDERIWDDNENWSTRKGAAMRTLEHIGISSDDCTLTAFKSAVQAQNNNPDLSFYTQAFFDFEEAGAVFDYVKPYVNGTFLQQGEMSGNDPHISYKRFINGFETDESILITGQTKKIIYSEAKYTEDDLQKVPDIAALIEKLSGESLTPPHLDTEGLTQENFEISGWYRKTDGKVWGIVKAEWLFYDQPNNDYYQDDRYYLASCNGLFGSYREVSRDELLELIGEDYRVEVYEYGSIMNRVSV